MSDIRSEICRIVSEMLDNPDEHGIYPTTRCYDELEALYSHALAQQKGADDDAEEVTPGYVPVIVLEAFFEDWEFTGGAEESVEKLLNKYRTASIPSAPPPSAAPSSVDAEAAARIAERVQNEVLGYNRKQIASIVMEELSSAIHVNYLGAAKQIWAAYVSRLPDCPSDTSVPAIAAIIRKHASEHAGEQGWVKCSERMPAYGTWCLCWTIMHDAESTGCLEKLYWGGLGELHWQQTHDEGPIHAACTVTHWQPLPAAPDSAGKQ